MLVRLSPRHWRRMGLHEHPERLDVVRAAFFLGIGLHLIYDLAAKPEFDEQCVEVLRVARLLGMSDKDLVILDPEATP